MQRINNPVSLCNPPLSYATMASPSDETKTILGSPNNFWLWSAKTGFDLSHPPTPDSEPIDTVLHLKCEISNVIIDPAKTALVIIDLQNYTLSSALRDDLIPDLFEAEKNLLEHGIPAARKAKIQVVWLNWGLTDEDLKTLPPGSIRSFGWESRSEGSDYGIPFSKRNTASAEEFIQCGESRRSMGLGDELGEVTLENGVTLDAGRALFKGTWNADLHEPLAAAFKESQSTQLPDVLFHKNRNSGMCEAMTACTKYLEERGLRTLLFCGMNTDQCVLSTLYDAQMKGFDCIMLNDGCATDSPAFTQQSSEWQACRDWGFLSSCKALEKATESL
jgi:nicotinamidase-related amidase